MRVALVHDYLNQYGGAERVLEILMEIFPDAPIYTLLYDKDRTLGRFEGRVKKTSFLDFGPIRKKHRPFIPFMPLAAQTMAIDDGYDLIISDSAGFAKGVTLKANSLKLKAPFHISYCHTPLRYAWEEEYLTGIISNFQLSISKPILKYLRNWDYNAGQKPDILIANSNFIAQKIKKYYGRDTIVVYPPVDLNVFCPSSTRCSLSSTSYFLAAGRLMHYKKFDLAVRVFAELGLPLKIVGGGPELEKLKEIRDELRADNIEFVSFVSDEELRSLYCGAKAFIFPQVEDFGLVAAEAIACGTPVIAYNAGGAKEIVFHGENGILFNEQTAESLKGAVIEFSKYSAKGGFDPQKIAASAKKFSKDEFIKKIKNLAN